MTAIRTEDDAPRGFVPRSELYRAQQRIEALEFELDEVRRQMREALGDRLRDAALSLPGMTLCRAGVLCALFATPGFASYEALALGAEPGRRDSDSDGPHVVKTWVHYVRRALEEAGCPPGAIINKWGVGYMLSNEARQWFSNRVYGGVQK